MKTIRKLAAPVLPFAGEFPPEQLPQAWQNLEEWEIACYPWSAPDGYRPKACARVGVHEGDLHVLMYALEPAIQAGKPGWAARFAWIRAWNSSCSRWKATNVT